MEKYIDIIERNTELFISNYLIEGMVKDVKGAEHVNVFITDLFPYLSTLYLLKENNLEKSAEIFSLKNKKALDSETDKLAKVLGHFLATSQQENEMTEKIRQLNEVVNEAQKKHTQLQKKIDELEKKTADLQKQNSELQKQNSELKKNCGVLKNSNENKDKELKQLKSEREKKEEQIKTLTLSNTNLENENQKQADKIRLLTLDNKELNKKVSELDSDSKKDKTLGFPSAAVLAGILAPHIYPLKKDKSTLSSDQKDPKEELKRRIESRKNLYPTASQISNNNVFDIIEDCLPAAKHYFNDDRVDLFDLNLDQLNMILKTVYNVGPLIRSDVRGMKYKTLKHTIVQMIKNNIKS